MISLQFHFIDCMQLLGNSYPHCTNVYAKRSIFVELQNTFSYILIPELLFSADLPPYKKPDILHAGTQDYSINLINKSQCNTCLTL